MRSEGDWTMLEEGIAQQLRTAHGSMKQRVKSLRLVAYDKETGRVVVFTNGKRIIIDEKGRITKEKILNPEIRAEEMSSVSSLVLEVQQDEGRDTLFWSVVVTVLSLVCVLIAQVYLLQ